MQPPHELIYYIVANPSLSDLENKAKELKLGAYFIKLP